MKNLNHNKNAGKLVLLIFLFTISYSSFATIRYVASDGTGVGTSWADASGDLQAMIDASAAGDSVWVKGGIYKPNAYPTGSSGGTTDRDFAFTMKNQVKVFGSFAGTELSLKQRAKNVMQLNQSVLSGDIGTPDDMSDNVYHVIISVSDDANTWLDGFIITKGQNLYGHSINLEGESINSYEGPALNSTKSSLQIKNCSIISNNSAKQGYGGIFIGYGYPQIDHCIFSNNKGGNGAGVSVKYNSGFVISNCVFFQNDGGNGGAIWSVNSSNGTIYNSVFTENNASTGSVYGSQYGSCRLTNCTIYNNTTSSGGPFYAYGGSTSIANSILWSNPGGINATATYSIIEGGFAGTGNSDSNPLFVDAANAIGSDGIWATSDDGLAVSLCSPAVDSANSSLNTQLTDIIGFNRTFNSLTDMGAYEIGVGSNAPLTSLETLELYSSKGLSNSWTGPNSFTASIQNPTISNLSTANSGTYTVTITGSTCSTTASIEVTIVDPPANPTITSPTTHIACAPDSIVVYGSCGLGQIIWYDNTRLDSVIIKNAGVHQVFAVCQIGDYFSIPSDTVEVTIHQIVYANITTIPEELVVCQPASLVLKANCSTGNTIWSDNSNLDSLVFSSVGTYDVYASCMANGCTSDTSSHVSLQIKALPSKPLILASTSTYACAPDSVVLSTSCLSGDIHWSDLSTTDSIILKNIDVYTFSTKCDLNGCINESDEITFEIKESPQAPVIGNHSTQSVCTPDTLFFSSACFGGGNVLWFNYEAVDTLVLKTPGTYIPTAVCDNGFCNSDTISWAYLYSIIQTPVSPTIEVSNTTICDPDSIIIKASCPIGNPLWSDNTLRDSIVVKGFGTYSYSVVCKSNDCYSDTTFVPLLEIKSKPQITITSNSPICEGQTLYLTASSALAEFYSWTGPVSSLDSFLVVQNAVLANSGKYFINVQGTNGCNSTDSTELAVNPNVRIYVNSSATGNNDGSSWSDAYTSLQSALDYPCFSETWVAGGTYYPSKTVNGYTSGNPRAFTFKLRNGKKIYGGFAGTETDLSQRTKAVIRANPSILSGDLGLKNDISDNAFNVVLISNGTSEDLLDGFTISGGNGDVFGSHYVNGRPLYYNNGSGINIDSSSTTIANCIIKDNTSSNNGGGVYITNHSDIKFIDCVIDSNASQTYGGGILAIVGSKITMDRSVISNNTSQFAGGIMSSEGAVILRNSILYKNTASWYSGGLRITSGITNESLIENCSFVKNISSYGGSGMEIQQSDSVRIVNTIFEQNIKSANNNSFAEDVLFDNSGYHLFIENSLLQHEISEGKYPENGTISGFQFTDTFFKQNPLFNNIDSPAGIDGILGSVDDGLIPKNCSPAVNTGTNTISTNIDFKNENRTEQSQTDMGAYETNHTPLPISVSLTSNYSGPICNGTELTFKAVGQNISEGVNYAFLINGVGVQYGSVDSLVTDQLNDTDSIRVYMTYGICEAMSNQIKVTVNPVPVNYASNEVNICQGQTLIFSANGGDSYVWTGPNSFAANYAGDSTFTINNAGPELSGSYYVSISNAHCTINDSVVVTILNPTVTLSSDAVGQICPGTAVTFQASISGNLYPSPNTIFTVNGVAKQSGLNQTFSTSSLNDGDVVSVTVSDACVIYSNQITMDVADFSGVTFTPLVSFCGGDTLRLSSSGGDSYAWSGPQSFSSLEQNPKIANATAAASGSYSVTISIGECTIERITVVSVSAFPYKSKIYVDASATGNNDGSSWTNAFHDFQSALDYGCFDTIWVAGGTYLPSKDPSGNASPTDNRDKSFFLPSNKVIIGSFAGTETALTQRDSTTRAHNPTILSGDLGVLNNVSDNTYHVAMVAIESNQSVFDGFTIQDGNANGTGQLTLGSIQAKRSYGGGLMSAVTATQMRNITFRNNKAKYGAGMYNQNGFQTIIDCIFTNNIADSTGGGLFNVGSNPMIKNAEFIQNSAAAFGGGGMANASSSPSLDKCLFKLNSGKQGGGIGNSIGSSPIVKNSFFIQNAASYAGGGFGTDGTSGGAAPLPKVINCVFANNTAQLGAGIANNYAFPTITNTTFYGNAASQFGGGVFNATSSNSTILNSVFYGNSANFGGADNMNYGGSANITYTSTQASISGTGNISGQNPTFVNAALPQGADGIYWTADDGFGLLSGSPVINIGTSTGAQNTDILGHVRPASGTPVDLGAYEFGSISLPTDVSASVTVLCEGQSLILTADCSTGAVNWYDVSTDGTSIGSGSSLNLNPVSTKTYYATCYLGGLESPRVATQEVVVNPIPSPPSISANPMNINNGENTTLTATGCSGTITWSPGDLTGISVTIALSNTTSFTATCTEANCSSNISNSVEVTVTSLPCLSLLDLISSDDDFSTGTKNKTASSLSGRINASNKITGVGKATYSAKTIVLLPGFLADKETVFLAEIGGCN